MEVRNSLWEVLEGISEESSSRDDGESWETLNDEGRKQDRFQLTYRLREQTYGYQWGG